MSDEARRDGRGSLILIAGAAYTVALGLSYGWIVALVALGTACVLVAVVDAIAERAK